jgi:hypothetical protein
VRRPGELGVGDRVEFAGRARTVISVSGTMIGLADRDGQVIGIAMAELVSAGGFALLDARDRAPVPEAALLNDLPEETVARALWWQRHIVEVLRGVPPDAEPGALPRPEYDPSAVSLTRREQAKAGELTAAGFPVTASAVKQRRRRYQERGLLGMVDHRVAKRLPPHGRADPAVAAAMRQAIAETAEDSTRTAAFVLRRTRQILAASDEQAVGEMPSERTLYRLFGRLQAGTHATGSARTRRSLAARPDGPFGRREANAPGELMEIDSTPLDVLVRLSDGVVGRVELTALADVATRTVTAAVLRPTTKAPDASVLLARGRSPRSRCGRAGRRPWRWRNRRCRSGGCWASTSVFGMPPPARLSSRPRSWSTTARCSCRRRSWPRASSSASTCSRPARQPGPINRTSSGPWVR